MPDLSVILFGGVIGAVTGFFISIPVGPVNITIINEGAHRGFVWALLIGAGAVTMETLYCAAAFTGFSSLLSSRLLRATMELLSFLVMAYLGIRYLLVRDLPSTTRTVERVEHRLHPHTAFAIGFVRVLGNPAVLLFWITLSATFMSHGWVADDWLSKTVCVAGMSLGAALWFVFLSLVVAAGHGRFSTATLVRMSHASGACLLILAMLIAARLIRILAERGGGT